MGRNNRSKSDKSTDETSHRVSAEMVDQPSDAPIMEGSDLDRIVTVEEFEDLMDTDLISAAVEIVQSGITEDRTATVQVIVTNISPHPLTIQTDGLLPLSELESEEEQPGLLLLPEDDHNIQRTLHCWQPDKKPELEFDEQSKTKLKQGEDIRRNYEVWSHHRNNNCFPLGDYNFKETYTVDSEDKRNLDWSFTLSVENP